MITLQEVKDFFPNWGDYTNNDDPTLQREIDAAEDRITEYIPSLTDTNITDALKLHLLNIVIKRLFDRIHGDKEFEHTPQIVKAYEETVKRLNEYRQGLFPDPDTTAEETRIKFTSKDRRFDEWFL